MLLKKPDNLEPLEPNAFYQIINKASIKVNGTLDTVRDTDKESLLSISECGSVKDANFDSEKDSNSLSEDGTSSNESLTNLNALFKRRTE